MRQLIAVPMGILLVVMVVGSVSAADAGNGCSSSLPTKSNGTWYSVARPGRRQGLVRVQVESTKMPCRSHWGAGANYRLDLYKGCSTKITGSDRSGTQYEDIIRKLGAGTYYVKVASSTGNYSPTPYNLRFRLLGSGLTILSHTTYVDSIDFRHILGEVHNASSDTGGSWISTRPSTLDWAGRRHRLHVHDADIVISGTRSPFDMFFDPPLNYDHYKVSVNGLDFCGAS